MARNFRWKLLTYRGITEKYATEKFLTLNRLLCKERTDVFAEFQEIEISASESCKKYKKIQKNNLDFKFCRQTEDSSEIIIKIFQIEKI